MENSENDDPTKKSDVQLPPIKLPPPDKFDTRKSQEGTNTFGSKARKEKKRKKKERSHPTDMYKDVRRQKGGMGCCGGIGCLALIAVMLIAGVVAAGGWILFGDFREGYTVVRLDGMEETISDAPTVATLFVAPRGRIIYNAPQTTVPVAVAAREVEISGEFADNLSLRAGKVICRSDAHCHKDLNVYAIQYVDEGIQVDGEKKGKTLQ